MINLKQHENAVVAGVNIDNMDKEDGENKKNYLSLSHDDNNDNCDGEDLDYLAANVVEDDANVGAFIDFAVFGTTGTNNAIETEAVQKRREKMKHLLNQVKFTYTCTVDMVVFIPNNKDIISIGGISLNH